MYSKSCILPQGMNDDESGCCDGCAKTICIHVQEMTAISKIHLWK